MPWPRGLILKCAKVCIGPELSTSCFLFRITDLIQIVGSTKVSHSECFTPLFGNNIECSILKLYCIVLYIQLESFTIPGVRHSPPTLISNEQLNFTEYNDALTDYVYVFLFFVFQTDITERLSRSLI